MYTVCFLTLTIPCNSTLFCFFVKSLNKPLGYFIKGGIHILTQTVILQEYLVVFTVSYFVGNPVHISILAKSFII